MAAAFVVAFQKLGSFTKSMFGSEPYNANLWRPLERRRLSMARPFLVRRRTRKPCDLFLLVLLG
jgi:hypothetical protein